MEQYYSPEEETENKSTQQIRSEQKQNSHNSNKERLYTEEQINDNIAEMYKKEYRDSVHAVLYNHRSLGKFKNKEERDAKIRSRACLFLLFKLKNNKNLKPNHLSYIFDKIPQEADNIAIFAKCLEHGECNNASAENISQLLSKCPYGDPQSIVILNHLKNLDNFGPEHLKKIIEITPYKSIYELAEQLPYEKFRKEEKLYDILDTMRTYCLGQKSRDTMELIFMNKMGPTLRGPEAKSSHTSTVLYSSNSQQQKITGMQLQHIATIDYA